MRKIILPAILVAVLALMLCTTAIHPAKAYINDYKWLGKWQYYDPYWNTYYLTTFAENTNATLMVSVYNNYWWASSLNISAVKVYMDWNQNYSCAECSEADPVAMPYNTYHTFTITFKVPSTTVATNLLQHGYTIYVEEIDAADVVSLHSSTSGSGFTVYSTDQADAMLLYGQIGALFDSYGYYPGFDNSQANDLWQSGKQQYYWAESIHSSGDFSSAKTHYGTALTMLNDALSNESVYNADWQTYNDNYDKQYDAAQLQQIEAQTSYYEAQANASISDAEANMKEADADMKLADAGMMTAYAWIMFGLGFIIFGVAGVIWAYRRPIHTT